MTDAVKDLDEAIEAMGVKFGAEKFHKRMSGSMDDRVYFEDVAEVLSLIYEIDAEQISIQIGQLTEEHCKSLFAKQYEEIAGK